MPPPASISASVGKFGKNKSADVLQVQSLLNKFISAGCLPSVKILVLDGMVGPKTIGAIMAFQKGILNFTKIDGRVDPGGLTINGLNGPLKWAKPAAGGEETSMDWLIALSAIKEGLVEFNLINQATSMARKIIVRNQKIRPVLINKTFESNLVKLNLSVAAGFGDFENNKMIISPSVPTSYPYLGRIGWIASVPMTTIPASAMQQTCPAVPATAAGGMFANTFLGCNVDTSSSVLGTVSYPGSAVATPFPTPSIYPSQAKVLILTP